MPIRLLLNESASDWFAGRFVEPAKDEYRWDLIDKTLETAKARGQTLLLLTDEKTNR